MPFGEKRYYELRPTIAIQHPASNRAPPLSISTASSACIRARAAEGAMRRQTFAIVEATGSPDPTRSHFDAQDYMESGTPA